MRRPAVRNQSAIAAFGRMKRRPTRMCGISPRRSAARVDRSLKPMSSASSATELIRARAPAAPVIQTLSRSRLRKSSRMVVSCSTPTTRSAPRLLRCLVKLSAYYIREAFEKCPRD